MRQAVLAPSILNLEQIKEQVVSRVEQQLNRDVELGQVRLEFFSGLGAGLDRLTIANPKGWQSPHFVQVDTLSVKVAFWPLFNRKIEVSKIILNTGEIVVERDAQGRFNYDDLTAAPADSAAAAEPAKSAPTETSKASKPSDGLSPLAGLLVSKLALNNIDIKFVDRMIVAGETVTTTVRQANLEAENIGFNTPIAFDLSSALLTDGDPNLKVRGRIGPVPNHGSLDVQQIPLQVSLEAAGLQLAPVVPYLGANPALTAGELGADIALQGTLGHTLHIKGQLSLDNVVMPGGQGQPLPTVTLTQDATVNLATSILTIADVQANLGALQTALTGTIKQFDGPSQLDFSLNTSAFAIADVIRQWPILAAALPDTMALQGNIGIKATVQGTPKQLHVVSHLDAQPLSIRLSDGANLALQNVRFAQDTVLDLAQSLITLNQANLDLDFLRTSLQGTIASFNSTPQLDLTLNTSTFEIADVIRQVPMLAEAVPNAAEAQGKIGLNLAVKGTPEQLHTIAHLDTQALSMRLGNGTPLALKHVRLAHDAVLDLPQSRITLNQTNLDLGFLSTSLQGTVANVNATPQVEFYVTTSNFNSTKVLSHLPMLADALPQPADVQGDLQLQAKLKGPVDKLIADAQVTTRALSLKSGSFHGGPAAKGGMHIALSQMQTKLNAQLGAANPPTVNVNLNAQHLTFDQRSAEAPAPSGEAPAPSGKAPPEAPRTSMAPPINARGNIAIAAGSITGVAFQHLKAVFSLLNGQLDSRQTVQMFGGAYDGSLTANLTHAKPDYEMALKLANIQTGDVVNTFTSTPNVVFGKLNTDLRFSGKGIDWNDISKTLTGSGKINLTNFKLTTLDIMPKLAKGLAAAGTVVGFVVPDDLSTRSFDKLKATLRLQNGKIRSDDLQLWGPDVQLLGTGLFGLDRSLSFDGTAVLLGKLAKQLGKRAKFLLDQEGHVKIPLAIQGTVTQPRIALNENHLAGLAQRALQQQIEGKAGEEANKLLDRILPGATSSDQPGSDQPGSDQPGGDQAWERSEPVPEPLKELNKIIQGLIKQ